MTLSLTRESWERYYNDPEREALWWEHYNEFWEVHQGKLPMSPDVRFYSALEAAGALETIVARKAGKMVGYCLMVVKRHNHYDALCAFEDSYFLTASERLGSAGIRLIREAIRVAKQRGVLRAFFMTKVILGPGAPPSIEKIFEHLGMEETDAIWALWL